MVCATFVSACSPDSTFDGIADAAQETQAPPGWPLEIGDTIEMGELYDLLPRFRPMDWANVDDLALNRSQYAARIRASEYGIATFESTFMEIPRDHNHDWFYACPPEGLALDEEQDVWTLDGALIVNLPPDIPCDPEKRYVWAKIYVGQVR